MAKGEKVPSGVKYWGHEKAGDKGKFHPAVGSGPNTTKHISGSYPSISKPSGGSDAACGANVKHSGTENHVKVVSKSGARGGPQKKSGANATPDGVRKFAGTSVKKK